MPIDYEKNALRRSIRNEIIRELSKTEEKIRNHYDSRISGLVNQINEMQKAINIITEKLIDLAINTNDRL